MASDGPPTLTLDIPSSEPEPTPAPQITLTFLLISGRRRTMSFEPETAIARVKELVWNAWPAEWSDETDRKPPAPNYLRMLYLGRLLHDDDCLKAIYNPISSTTLSPTTPTPDASAGPQQPVPIIHLSIRVVPPPSADDTSKKGKKRRPDADAGASGGGCCASCVIC